MHNIDIWAKHQPVWLAYLIIGCIIDCLGWEGTSDQRSKDVTISGMINFGMT